MFEPLDLGKMYVPTLGSGNAMFHGVSSFKPSVLGLECFQTQSANSGEE